MSRAFAVLVSLIVSLAPTARADLASETGLLQLNLGTAFANSENTGESIDGPALVLSGDYTSAPSVSGSSSAIRTSGGSRGRP